MLPGYRCPQPQPRPDSSSNLGPWWSESSPMDYHHGHPYLYHYCPPPAYYPPPFYYHAPYPSYAAPPPPYHFPVGRPPRYYEYDKERHCCGCPNHFYGHNVDEPKKCNGWYPFDLMNGKPLASPQEDDKKERKSEFPFPFFCIPGYDKLKESGTSPRPIQEPPEKLKIIPVNPSQGNNAVKDVKEKKTKENQIEVSEKAASETQSSSPSKSSKLAPVCLRVDPLPKKKNGNGTSSSPPGDKSRATNRTSSKANSCSAPVEQVSLENKLDKEKPVRDIKVNDQVSQVVEVVEKPMKKQLSTDEAAVRIQSFYRGHQLRKWEPLMKLKQIAKIREQVNQVRKRIQALESSFELQKEGKQRVLIGETVMSLLLQLDTIQGLHPIVREMRKVVAKELVSLQERLDSTENAGGEKKHLVINSSDNCVQQVDIETVASGPPELPDAPANLKETHNQFDIEEQLSSEVAKESTESSTHIETKNDSHTTQRPMNRKDGEINSEDVDSVQKKNQVQVDAVEEPAKSSVERVDDVQEKNNVPGVLQGIDSLDVQYTRGTGAEHQVHEDTCGTGAEHQVHELPQGSADMNEEHVIQELPPSDAKHSPEELPQEDLDAPEVDVMHVQKELQRGVSNQDISEPGAKCFQDGADASEVGPRHIQELPQRASYALEPDAVPYPNIYDNKEDVLQQCLDARPQRQIVGFGSGEGVQCPTREEEKDVEFVGDVQVLPTSDNCWRKELGGVQDNNDHSCVEHTVFIDVVGGQVEGEINEATDNKDLSLELTPKFDLNEKEDRRSESAADKNVTQEVEMKVEVIQVNNPVRVEAEDRKLLEENEKLREMIGKLLHEGKQQLTAISDLHGRVKDLERKLTKKKKLKMRKHKSEKTGRVV